MVFFAHGNFTKASTTEFVDEARKILNLKAVSKDSLSTVRCIQMGERHHRIDFPVEDESNENSVFMSYYQFGQSPKDPK